MTLKQFRDGWLLALGSVGFLHQVFVAEHPNYLVMGGSLSLIFGVPIIHIGDKRGGTP